MEKEAYDLIIKLSDKLSDMNFKWPDYLREKVDRVCVKLNSRINNGSR